MANIYTTKYAKMVNFHITKLAKIKKLTITATFFILILHLRCK